MRDLVIATDGSKYFVDSGSRRIRKIDPEGIITTVVGSGEYIGTKTTTPDFSGDNGLAISTRVANLESVALSPDGILYTLESNRPRLRRVGSFVPNFSINAINVASQDGRQIFQFAPDGSHLRTLDSVTGAVLFEFAYDAEGLLQSISDVDGDITRIIRSPDGTPSSIVSPDGQSTSVFLDFNGYLESVVDAENNENRMSYDTNGLMLTYQDPNGGVANYQYDDRGRLLRDVNPVGGGWTLERFNVRGPVAAA